MTDFVAERFDTMVSNSTLEHDLFFWKTLAEIRRVTKPSGLIILGAPGYGRPGAEKWVRRIARNIPFVGRTLARRLESLFASTLTLHVHNFPGELIVLAHKRFAKSSLKE